MTSSSSNTRIVLTALAIFSAIFLFVFGVGFGVWFSQNFAIVPKGELNAMVAEGLEDPELKRLLEESGVSLADQAALEEILDQNKDSVEELVRQAEENARIAAGPEQRPAAAKGPFQFKFTPGEKLKYAFKADINGKGMEILGGEPVDMDFDSGFTLETKSVAPNGNGKLELAWQGVKMEGKFMGSDFAMGQSPAGSNMKMNGQNMLDSAAGLGSVAGIPQMEFFNDPVQMEVGPDGSLLNVAGSEMMKQLVEQIPAFSTLEFPSPTMAEGNSWTTQLAMPVPGFDQTLPVTIENHFTGYKTIGSRVCAVIEQDVKSSGANTLHAIE